MFKAKVLRVIFTKVNIEFLIIFFKGKIKSKRDFLIRMVPNLNT